MVSPPDLYFTTSIKSHYQFCRYNRYFSYMTPERLDKHSVIFSVEREAGAAALSLLLVFWLSYPTHSLVTLSFSWRLPTLWVCLCMVTLLSREPF